MRSSRRSSLALESAGAGVIWGVCFGLLQGPWAGLVAGALFALVHLLIGTLVPNPPQLHPAAKAVLLLLPFAAAILLAIVTD